MDNVKRYLQFIKEADDSEITKKSDSNYDNIKEDVKKKIEDTIKNSGGEFKSFIEKYISTPTDVAIEGLISDDQIYDFWRTYENEIDSLLNDANYFEKPPKEIGVYKYVINSTKEAIELTIKMLSE
jgi:hypothetical protein